MAFTRQQNSTTQTARVEEIGLEFECLLSPARPSPTESPPKHLPRNFFKPGYLESLLNHEIEKLDVQDKDYNLRHTDEVLG